MLLEADLSNFATCNENYMSCSSDCASGQKDNLCDKIADNICDPDCSKEDDYDCKKISFDSKKLLLYLGMGIVVGLVIFWFLKKKRKSIKRQ